jgi:hypothetical protein
MLAIFHRYRPGRPGKAQGRERGLSWEFGHNLLSHVDRPNSSSAADVEYPRRIVMIYVDWRSVKSAPSGNLHDFMVYVHSVFLFLYACEPWTALKGRPAKAGAKVLTSSQGYM